MKLNFWIVAVVFSLMLVESVFSYSSDDKSSSSSFISNAWPRLDDSKNIMDAHDSKIIFHDGLFYWFAASYGECQEPAGGSGCAQVYIGACGFRTDHNVSLFVSNDLQTWTFKGVVLQAAEVLPANSVLFAPKTVFNKKLNKWVIWYNYITGDFSNSFYGVATSTSSDPLGPYKVTSAKVTTLRYPDDGDENIFIDDDGVGYIIYTSIQNNHQISIERLSDDYSYSLSNNGLNVSESSGFFGDANSEAPIMFKRNQIYYVLFGSCCCYCESGSQVSVYTSNNPLGPYTKQNTLPNLFSQATDAFTYLDDQGETQAIYVGDHWQSAQDGLKGHDNTVWAPFVFDDATGTISASYQDNFTISIGTNY